MNNIAGAAAENRRPLERAGRYLFAAAAIAGATLVRWFLDPALGDHLPYVTYFVAVALVAWRCGLGPSLFTLVAGWWTADFFFFSPRYVWYPNGNTPLYIVGAATYFMVGLSSIAVCEAMRSAKRKAEQHGELLRVTLASIGDAVITCDTQGRIASMNAIAELLTGWKEHEAARRTLSEVFRIVNEDTRKPVENPVDRVLAEGRIVGLANHSILIGKDNTERGIDDSAAPIRDAAGNLVGVVLVFRDVTDERKLVRALQHSDARKAEIMDTALDCIITIDHDGTIIDFNPACEQTFGYNRADAIGREMGELIVPPALRERHRAGLARYLSTGEAKLLNRRIELTAMRSDGTEFPVELAITRISGDALQFTGYLRDITEHKNAEARQRMLTNELNHRVKNVMSVIQSIAYQTARATPDPTQFFDTFSSRLIAMSRVHDILTRNAWTGADLHSLAEATLAPYRSGDADSIVFDGPLISLSSDAAVSISLMLHELATNAAKYGALSQPGGRLSMIWRELNKELPSVALEWCERNGPPVQQPGRQGFGTKLIEMVAIQLAADVSIAYPVEGLTCRMQFPLKNAPPETNPD